MSLTDIVRKLGAVLGFVGGLGAATPAFADEPPQPLPVLTLEETRALETDPNLRTLVGDADQLLYKGSRRPSSSADQRNADGSLANPETTLRRIISSTKNAQYLLKMGWKLEFDYNPSSFWSGESLRGTISHPHGLDYHLKFQVIPTESGGWKTVYTTGMPNKVLDALLIPLHTEFAEFQESQTGASRTGFTYFAFDRCQSVRTTAPTLVERYRQLWSDLDDDLKHHLARANEITAAQLEMYTSQVDALRGIAQGQLRRIRELQGALHDAERLRPQLEQRAQTLGTEVGFSCVVLDRDLTGIETSLTRTQGAAAEIRETLMNHKRIIANSVSDFDPIHPSKRDLVWKLNNAKDYATIRDVIAQIGDYTHALPDWTDELVSTSATAGARVAPPKPRPKATTPSQRSSYSSNHAGSSRTSSSTAPTQLTLVLDANQIPTATGQGIINNSYRYAAKHPKPGKTQSRTAYRSPMSRFWAFFSGKGAEKAARHTSANVLDAIIETGRSTDFSGGERCVALKRVAETTKDLYNNGRYHGPFRIDGVEVKGCDSSGATRPVAAPQTQPGTQPAVQPINPQDDRVKPGAPDETIPPIPTNILNGAIPTHNDLDSLIKTYTAHSNAFSNGILNPKLYVANARATISDGNNYVTQEGRLARAILTNEGGLVHKYTDRIADLMRVVAETNDARVLGEMHHALVEAAGRRYVQRTSRVLAQVAGAALAVEQKQKVVVDSLEHSVVAASSGPKPLLPDHHERLGTARYKADALIDNLHGALFAGDYDLAGRLAEGMSSRQIVKAELEMNGSYALTGDQRRIYGSFFEATEGLAQEREAQVRAKAREREYAENFADLAHGAGMKQHRLYNDVRAALINGNVDYACNVLRDNNLLNLQDLTAIETGIDGSQLTAATRARIARDVEGFEKLAAMTTTPQGPATARVIPFPQRIAVAYDVRKAA